jgi:hypothetical protein
MQRVSFESGEWEDYDSLDVSMQEDGRKAIHGQGVEEGVEGWVGP